MKGVGAALLLFLLGTSSVLAQRTDLSGLTFCIDPGHGGHDPADDRHIVPEPGTDFWESESNFQKAQMLKALLEELGATVLLTRTTNDYPNDDNEPTLSQRVAFANANNVHWFHSIHSNATGVIPNTTTNYTLMLVREKRPGGPASSAGNGLGVPETQEAWDVSSLFMAPDIRAMLRTQRHTTWLDWTFYGGTNGGFSLGVLRGLLMPGELSEGSMHDYYPETRRLMNNDYRKLEAYALRNSWMKYFGLPPDTLCIVAGIQREIVSSQPVNLSRVRMLPENRLASGDTYNNGFYLFDRLAPGVHTIRFETPGYAMDSVMVTIAPGTTTFVDRSLEFFSAPSIVASEPVNGENAFAANQPIRLSFTKPMDTASVEQNFSIAPPVAGGFSWTASNSVLQFSPDSILPFYQTFVVRIDTGARSAGGQALDGNGDGNPGDPFVLVFTTTYVDVIVPSVVSAFPASRDTLPATTDILNITFNELLDASTVNATSIAVREIGGTFPARIVHYAEAAGRGGVTLQLSQGFLPGKSYRVGITHVKDRAGNEITTLQPVTWDFSIELGSYAVTVIDSLSGPLSAWGQPSASPWTEGVEQAVFEFASLPRLPSTGNGGGSGRLAVVWDTNASSWLADVVMDSSAADRFRWNEKGSILQAYVHGDASGTHFRFVVDDGAAAGSPRDPSRQEVSPWFTVNWVGWRRVAWDMERDSLGSWTGDGKLSADVRLRGVQVSREPLDTSRQCEIFISALLLFQRPGSDTLDPWVPPLPQTYVLHQNFPNPFNPSTEIRYEIPVAGRVTLKVFDLLGREVGLLVNGEKNPGFHSARFDARGLGSGMYVYRLEAGGFAATNKMLLLR